LLVDPLMQADLFYCLGQQSADREEIICMDVDRPWGDAEPLAAVQSRSTNG
jgi:hypothetical protein